MVARKRRWEVAETILALAARRISCPPPLAYRSSLTPFAAASTLADDDDDDDGCGIYSPYSAGSRVRSRTVRLARAWSGVELVSVRVRVRVGGSYNKAEGAGGFRTRLCLICLLLRLAPKADVLSSPELLLDSLTGVTVGCRPAAVSLVCRVGKGKGRVFICFDRQWPPY